MQEETQTELWGAVQVSEAQVDRRFVKAREKIYIEPTANLDFLKKVCN